MSTIKEEIMKDINSNSEKYNAFGIIHDKKEIDKIFPDYVINDRIKELYGQTVKIDKILEHKKVLSVNYLTNEEILKELKDYYSYRIKNSDNLWVSGIFFKEIDVIDNILPEELFKL